MKGDPRVLKAISIAAVAAMFSMPASAQLNSGSVFGAMSSETPTRAASFIDSIGINTHFDQTPYNGPEFPSIAKLLVSSGIKHIRDTTNTQPQYIAKINSLAESGIRTEIVTRPKLKAAVIQSYPSMIPNSMEAYEGPNEPDLGKDPNWPATIRAFMQQLHDDVKSDPATAHYPIVAPAVTGSHDLLGDINAYVDYGNTHDYFSTYNPGTRGWGNRHAAGIYGSLSYNMNLARVISGSKPIESTETGYGSTPSGTPQLLDYVTDGKYIPRLYFVQYNAAIVRTYVYELLDPDKSGRLYRNFGLIDADLKPKPAYNAVKAVIADLTDASTSFTPAPLTYEIAGNYRNVQHTLLEKSDGSYYLALWLEVPSWKNGMPIEVNPQAVRLLTQKPMSAVSVLRLGDDGNPSTSVLRQDGARSISLRVTDSVSIIKLVP